MSEKKKESTKKSVKDTMSRSWFCVMNFKDEEKIPEYIKPYVKENPQKVCELMAEKWIGNEGRSGAWVYCVSADGLHHVHTVLESSPNKTRFSAVKKAYPEMHIEPTQGNKAQVEDYIYKRGAFEEKGEKVLYTYIVGEIKGKQGQRSDLVEVKSLIDDGLTPIQILNTNPNYYRISGHIDKMFYNKKLAETPCIREVVVYWHYGATGTGKTRQGYLNMTEKGREGVYITSAENEHPFDRYVAQSELWIDELRQNSPYFTFARLLGVCDVYTADVSARYNDNLMLWKEVHITSPLLPWEVYDNLRHKQDKLNQLLRRIKYYVYHYKDENGEIQKYTYDTHNKGMQIDRSIFEINAKIEKIKKASGALESTPEEQTNNKLFIDDYTPISEKSQEKEDISENWENMSIEEYCNITGESIPDDLLDCTGNFADFTS